jgi:hypothetical protein
MLKIFKIIKYARTNYSGSRNDPNDVDENAQTIISYSGVLADTKTSSAKSDEKSPFESSPIFM